MPAPIGKPSVDKTFENIQAVNVAFGFTLPKEVANQGRVKTWKEANDVNKGKCALYVPLMKSVMFGQLTTAILRDEFKVSAFDKAFFARAVITEALGTVFGSIVLLVIDIFFTILVKPFLNLAVWIHNKKVEREVKAKELEAEAKKNTFFEKIDEKNSSSSTFMFHNPESRTVFGSSQDLPRKSSSGEWTSH